MTDSQLQSKDQEKGGAGFFAGVVLGTIIGGVAAFMLSTEDGKKKAEKLIEEGEKLLDLAEKKAERVYESLEEQVRAAADFEMEEQEKTTSSSSPQRFFRKNGKKLSSY